MILEDFVMLGTTVPEPNSDGRVFVCSAGVSEEYRKLIRIYPLARRNAPRRWAMHRVQLERNPRDSRDESFQIAGERKGEAHQWINYKFDTVREKVPEQSRRDLLSRYVIGSIQEANKKRLSLAILQPEQIELDFEANPASSESAQLTLFDSGDSSQPSGARRFAWMPRLRFRDECGSHNLMLRDWGSFELQRKHDEHYFRQNLADALNLKPSSSLLVGNMNNKRTVWLVISVLNRLKGPDTLFDPLLPEPVSLPNGMARIVYERNDWTCVRCGSDSDRLTVQPRTSTKTMSTPDPSDYEAVCRPCIMPEGLV